MREEGGRERVVLDLRSYTADFVPASEVLKLYKFDIFCKIFFWPFLFVIHCLSSQIYVEQVEFLTNLSYARFTFGSTFDLPKILVPTNIGSSLHFAGTQFYTDKSRWLPHFRPIPRPICNYKSAGTSPQPPSHIARSQIPWAQTVPKFHWNSTGLSQPPGTFEMRLKTRVFQSRSQSPRWRFGQSRVLPSGWGQFGSRILELCCLWLQENQSENNFVENLKSDILKINLIIK